jgi:ElaB/YqjD/DUF883 family membrane-anchored ribosome-binding protein
MSNIGGRAQSQVNKLGESISDLGSNVGDMASRQYHRAQDMATDALDETSHAIQRNPLTAMGIGLGVGFLFGFLLAVILTEGRGYSGYGRPS